MSNYHELAGYSSSELKAMAKGEKTWAAEYLHKTKKYNKIFALGSAIHMALQERDRFEKLYAFNPGLQFNRKDGKVWKKEIEKEGKVALNTTDTDIIQNVVRGAKTTKFSDWPFNMSSNIYDFFNDKCIPEQEFVLEGYELDDGLKRTVKVKPDAYLTTDDSVVIFDVKSCSASAYASRIRTISYEKYYIQAIWYANILKNVLKKDNVLFYFVWVEKGAEGNIAITPFNNEQLQNNWYQCVDLVRKIERKRTELIQQNEELYEGVMDSEFDLEYGL